MTFQKLKALLAAALEQYERDHTYDNYRLTRKLKRALRTKREQK